LPKQDIEVVIRQLERFSFAAESQSKWAKGAVECVDFSEGKQWKQADIIAIEGEGRPALTWNKIAPLTRLVFGFQRANRHDIKYSPGSDGMANDEIAQALTHAAKQIHQSNMAEWKFSEMFRDGILSGRGYLDYRLGFDDNILGEVVIESLDPFSTYPDPEADSYDPKKWNDVFTTRWMSLNDIELMYNRQAAEEMENQTGQGLSAVISSLGYDGELDDDVTPERSFGLWKHMNDTTEDGQMRIGPLSRNFSLFDHVDRNRKVIRVIDRQHIRLSRVRRFIDLATGATREIPETWNHNRIVRVKDWAENQGQPLGVMDRVERKVRWTVTAADVLLFDDWSPYRTFTVIPYFGYFRRGKTLGMVHDLRDPQREINKRRSAEIHIVGTSASSGWMFEENSMTVDSKEILKRYGSKPGINLELKDGGLDKIKRIEPPVPPTHMERLEQKANVDIKEISGINESALGQEDKAISGKAIEARQRQAVIGIETYMDNMDRTRHLAGEKTLELVQDHYTEERFLRAMGEDLKPQDMKINQRAASGAILNDIRVGKYTTTISKTPSTATFQEAQFEQALEMLDKGIPIPPDILVELSTMPQKDEIKRRIQEQLIAQGLMTPPNQTPPNGASPTNGAIPPSGPQPDAGNLAALPIPGGSASAGFDGANIGFGQ
jgi:hypothetical protein